MPKRQISYLFTLRLWLEEIGQGQFEWRGQLQHVKSGEACYFHNWPGMVEQLLLMLPNSTGDRPEKDDIEQGPGDSNDRGPRR